MLAESKPRVSIAHLPTPVELLHRLSAELGGPSIWCKRDDQTGLATGGNKTRKLEFLVAEAIAQGADVLLTCGAAQSNHARQTAAAAAKFGLDCTLVLHRPQDGSAPAPQGNLVLDRLVGARIVWADGDLEEALAAIAEDLRGQGRSPYVVPYGGSNPVGASGYVAAMDELLVQCAQMDLHFDHIVLASSSGGTQAGLAVGARARGYDGRILGLSVDPEASELKGALAELATATAHHLGVPWDFSPKDFDVEDGYRGEGYGVVGELEREAIQTVARTEGLLLDPVYTGRAFGGLLDLIRDGAFASEERVLFWHTGGIPGLFAYVEDLQL